jgi:predicted DNA-binding protein (UPF0251 family)
MARPQCCRRIAAMPVAAAFGPVPASLAVADQVVVTLDEFEAVRLADLEELYQERAAERMGVSRPTFSRIIDSAHRKIAEALVSGKSLRIEGGSVRVSASERPRCSRCGRESPRACECPYCRGEGSAKAARQPGAHASPACGCRRGLNEGDSTTEAGCPEHSAKERKR